MKPKFEDVLCVVIWMAFLMMMFLAAPYVDNLILTARNKGL